MSSGKGETVKITAGGLTYEADFAVKVGDVVELPDTGYLGGTWRAEVTEAPAVNPYDGHCKRVIRNLGSPLEIAQRRVKAAELELRAARAEVRRLRTEVAQ